MQLRSELREITKSLNYGPVIRTSKTEILLAHKFEFDNAIAVECDGMARGGSRLGTQTKAFEMAQRFPDTEMS